MKKTVFLFLLLFSTLTFARFEIQTSTGYESNTDGKTNSSFLDMTNHLFLGASIGSKEQTLIGQNVSYVSNTYKTTATDKITTLELGPRLNYYFNEEQNFFGVLNWNPYAKGTRTVSGTSNTISGWSYLVAIGAVLKINKNFYFGTSINYHSLTITESVTNSTSTTVSNNYTSIMPMINMTLRFR